MKKLVQKTLIYHLMFMMPIKAETASDNCSILLFSKLAIKDSNTREFKILYGSENSARKASKKLTDPAKLFKVYKCDEIIIVNNARKIKSKLNGSLAKIIDSCESEFTIFFVFNGKTYSGKTEIDVSYLVTKQ